jgi:predicted N-formylglutamate amidohydrolase
MLASNSDWPSPCEFIEESGASDLVFVCEHASNFVPTQDDQLGLDHSDLQRHIAWDIGAAEVTRKLAIAVGAPAFLGTFSRLLIDLNRPPRCVDSIPLQSEGTAIPGNAELTVEEIVRRETMIFTPFHNKVAAYLNIRQKEGRPTRLVAIHSFTPVYFGVSRPWHAGILFERAEGFARFVLNNLRADKSLNATLNQPYSVCRDSDYAIPIHGDDRQIDAILIEIRNDLIRDKVGTEKWANLLSSILLSAPPSYETGAAVGRG